MNVGYIRVSSEEQSTARQYADFKVANVRLEKIFEEKLSGKDTARPALKEMLNFVRDGDVLYIESISRLGRSLTDLFSIVGELKNKKVQLVSLKEHIDTTTPEGRLTFALFAALAQFERDLLKVRQREGIEACKAAGKHLGRPKAVRPDNFGAVYTDWKTGKMTAVEAFNKLGLKKATFYKFVKEYEKSLTIQKKN